MCLIVQLNVYWIFGSFNNPEFSAHNLENSHRRTEIFPSNVICPQTHYIKSDPKFIRRYLLVADQYLKLHQFVETEKQNFLE